MKIYPNLPIFAMGLSMGGMTCYYLSLRNPSLFKGVIMMAPAIKNVMGGALIGLVTGIARFLPKSTRLIKPPRGQCAKNPQITEDIEKDKLSFSDRASLKSLETMLDTMDVAPLTFSNYEANFVIVQGGLDKLVNPIGAFELYDKCKSKDKEVSCMLHRYGSIRICGMTSGTKMKYTTLLRGLRSGSHNDSNDPPAI